MFSEYAELLRRNHDYRNLWLGFLVSQLGDWFNLIASASLIALITESGTAVSFLFLARFLPLFLFSPIAGVVNDRFNRKQVMIASDLLRALTVLGFLLVRDASLVWLFYTLTAVQFMLSALFIPGRSALLARVVEKHELVAANALDSLTWSTMLAVGALLGGLATAAFGITTAFILDSLTFVGSAWLIGRIRADTRVLPRPAGSTSRSWQEIIGGVQYLRTVPVILVIALVKAGGSLVWGAINVLEVTFAEKHFPLIFEWNGQTYGQGGTITLALMYTIIGLGTGFGPLVLRRWLGDQVAALRRGITIGFAMVGLGILLMAVPVNLTWYLLMSFVRTVGSGTVWVFSAAMLQMVVPDHVRGRVFAFEFAMLTLTQSISIFWAGAAQDFLDLSIWTTTLLTGIGGAGMLLLWLAFQRASGRKALVPDWQGD